MGIAKPVLDWLKKYSALLAVIITALGLFSNCHRQQLSGIEDKLDGRLVSFEDKMNVKLAAFEDKINARFVAFEEKMNARLVGIEKDLKWIKDLIIPLVAEKSGNRPPATTGRASARRSATGRGAAEAARRASLQHASNSFKEGAPARRS